MRFDSDQEELEHCLRRVLALVGENPDRPGLQETPARAAKAWRAWTSGYGVDVPGLFKVFDDDTSTYDQMILVDNIEFTSHCEHHMAAITGVAHVAYIPNDKGHVVGLSKLARVVDAYARRLQVQERMTAQIADAVFENMQPRGVGVLVRARHGCMCGRGVMQRATQTTTSALKGCFKNEPETRAEFLKLVDMAERRPTCF